MYQPVHHNISASSYWLITYLHFIVEEADTEKLGKKATGVWI